ncbi:hypothetical protein F4779DRAFT_602171 [Xylariaceae sp. FL0662B]|nr:hypothetical protein F4779DRAFT_602171 [Xylariaceae sp. FL0662B]
MSQLYDDVLESILDTISGISDVDKKDIRDVLKDQQELDEAALAHRVFSSIIKYLNSHDLMSNLQRRTIQNLVGELKNRCDIQNTTDGKGPAAEGKDSTLQLIDVTDAVVKIEEAMGNFRPSSPLPGYVQLRNESDQPSNSMEENRDLSVQHHEHDLYKTYSKGSKILEKQGWSPGQGLGVKGEGIKTPISNKEEKGKALGRSTNSEDLYKGPSVSAWEGRRARTKKQKKITYPHPAGPKYPPKRPYGRNESEEFLPPRGPSVSEENLFGRGTPANEEYGRRPRDTSTFGGNNEVILYGMDEYDRSTSNQVAESPGSSAWANFSRDPGAWDKQYREATNVSKYRQDPIRQDPIRQDPIRQDPIVLPHTQTFKVTRRGRVSEHIPQRRPDRLPEQQYTPTPQGNGSNTWGLLAESATGDWGDEETPADQAWSNAQNRTSPW